MPTFNVKTTQFLRKSSEKHFTLVQSKANILKVNNMYTYPAEEKRTRKQFIEETYVENLAGI